MNDRPVPVGWEAPSALPLDWPPPTGRSRGRWPMGLAFLEGVKGRTVRAGVNEPVVGPEHAGKIDRYEPTAVLTLAHRRP